jgi:signal transduction histidine kinase
MKADEILNLYSTIKSIEHEKEIKISLFKLTHEVKNPISVVKGYIDMFDVNDKNKSIRYIGIINQEINRTLNLLSDFMQFSKINLEIEEVDVGLLFDDVKQIINPMLNNKNIKCTFKIEDNIFINADYNRLKQVIINLIKNSVEASKTNGIISVTLYKDNDKIYIIVKDNGIGMTKEELNNMFKPFHTTKENGTGLGVCLSKEIIEAHKGKLAYNSIKNKETIAKIVLPFNN